jgi:Trk K+ transport system NAD-binding subunit
VGVRFLVGDARNEQLLAQAGIAHAKALIVATEDDLTNVTIALHARNVAPAVPVVARLFDQDLAKRLEQTLGLRRGISASALAAPAFVAASMGDTIRTIFELSGETWAVEEVVVAPGSSWVGKAIRDVVPSGAVLLAHGRGDDSSFAPDGAVPVIAGDVFTWLARPVCGRDAALHRPGKLRRMGRTLWRLWAATPKGLRYSLFAMVALVALSIGVFDVALGLSSVDAYYFVLTTLTTTGYGDYNLQAAHPLVKIYGTMVMVLGGCLFAVVFSMLTDLLLRTRFSDVLAQGANHYQDHIIVAGLGNTGFRVLRALHDQGEEVVAIENREAQKFVATARSMVPVILGDAGAAETLQQAGLSGAKTVLALTDDDLTNLGIALAAKQANPRCRVVARVFDTTLADRMRQALPIDGVLSVSQAVIPTFVGAALDGRVVRALVMRGHFLALLERFEGGAVSGNERVVLTQSAAGNYVSPVGRPAAATPDVVCRWTKLGGEN